MRMLPLRAQTEVKNMLVVKKKRDPCYTVAESLATLLPSLTWKAGCVSNELGDLVEITKQTAKITTYFFPAVYNKMREQRDIWKEEWLNKNESELENYDKMVE